MYSKSSVSSYVRGKKPVKSYKRNVIPFAVGPQMALHAVTEGAKEIWKKGKKSKLGKALSNPSITLSVSDTQYKVGDIVTGNDGRVIEILTRSYKHPNKYKYTYKVIKTNPSSVSPEVEDLSKEWHGRDVLSDREVEEVENYEEDLVDLGELEELGILAVDGSLFTISFKKDRPTLCCEGTGQNLEVIGGDQKLDLNEVGVEVRDKRLIPLGYIYSIVYETDKFHLEGSNGYPESYIHYFAEEFYKGFIESKDIDKEFPKLLKDGTVQEAIEGDKLPTAIYNKTDERILISGGNYTITELGIKD